MSVTYQQTDTSATFNVGCSGALAGATTAAREAQDGGTAGSTEVTVDPGNLVTGRACFDYVVPSGDAPGISNWTDGTWNITVNFTTGDAGTSLHAVHVCDYDGSTYASVCSETSIGWPTTSGSTTRNIAQGGDYSPQNSSTSRPFIVIRLSNTDSHGSSACGITPDGTIVAPYTVGGGAAVKDIVGRGIIASPR